MVQSILKECVADDLKLFVLATLSVGGAETLRDEKVLSELKLRASKNYQGANVKNTIAGKKHLKKIIAMKKSAASTTGNVEEEKKDSKNFNRQSSRKEG